MNHLLIYTTTLLHFSTQSTTTVLIVLKKRYVRLVSNQTTWCTKCSSDVKSKNHMHHRLLEDLFYQHWYYHLYEILLEVQLIIYSRFFVFNSLSIRVSFPFIKVVDDDEGRREKGDGGCHRQREENLRDVWGKKSLF